MEDFDRRVLLQGNGRWETVWEPLVQFAKTHDLNKVKIDLNLAWLHESYHGTWQSLEMPAKEFQFGMRIPLFAFHQSEQTQVRIGCLEIITLATDPNVHQRISDLSDQLIDLCPEIDAVVQELELARQEQADEALESVEVGSQHDESDRYLPERLSPSQL
jgi:UDP-GlcNAc:undecaprenyl-phosphate GlcNAc-1-phosphate transferase